MNIDSVRFYQKINLQVHSDIAASEEVLSWFEQLNQPEISTMNWWWQCQTLLIEGFINIVEHANTNQIDKPNIEIEAIRFDEHIEIRILSYGKAFNLEKKLAEMQELDSNFDERGRGLKIIQKIADKLSYAIQSDNRYCLFMSKNI